MEKLIQLLGWTFLIMIAILIIAYIIDKIKEYREARFKKRRKKLHDIVVYCLRSSSDWPGSPLTKPFQKVLDYISDEIEHREGFISSQNLREEIYKIIENEMATEEYIESLRLNMKKN